MAAKPFRNFFQLQIKAFNLSRYVVKPYNNLLDKSQKRKWEEKLVKLERGKQKKNNQSVTFVDQLKQGILF